MLYLFLSFLSDFGCCTFLTCCNLFRCRYIPLTLYYIIHRQHLSILYKAWGYKPYAHLHYILAFICFHIVIDFYVFTYHISSLLASFLQISSICSQLLLLSNSKQFRKQSVLWYSIIITERKCFRLSFRVSLKN